MTKEEREEREYISMFADERIAKKSWRNLIGKSLTADASILPTITDGKGNETAQSIIYRQAYDNVLKRLKANGLSRLPMQAEIIIEANIIKAAFDSATFTTILERTAGKVKDEVSLSTSAYADLTDEQLEILAEYEHKKAKGDLNGSNN